MLFIANLATCPNCKTEFPHNKINGVSLIAAISDIEARKKMHCRLMLDSLERLDLDRPTFDALRKVVLDSMNDFNRDVQIVLGADLDAE